MAFGLRYYAELRSKFKEVFWRVEIAERDYTGPNEAMSFNGSKPLTLTWENRGDEFFVPVKASEVTIDILCTENFRYMGLFTSDPRKFRVSIFRNTKLYWRGFVVADLYSESFAAPPYQVSIKAVDGFKLLENIPFQRPDGSHKTGRYNLCDLVTECIALLELNMTVAVWLNLYADGMNLNDTSLKQVYVDLERFYAVYDEPSYRDVLELCLRPFAGQIFQSNGSLHIRRVVSLYEDSRPTSFLTTGKSLPTGWISKSNGQLIYNAAGASVQTSQVRQRIDSMWDEELSISGESTLDIVAALKSVTVSVKNKGVDDMIPFIGFYNLSFWNDPYGFLDLTGNSTLRFSGDNNRQGYVIETTGYSLQQCSYTLTLEYALQARYSKYGSGYRSTSASDYTVKFYYGIKLVGTTGTWWLQDDGQWVTTQGYMEDEVKTSTASNKKIDIQGIPAAGKLKFYIKQTLKYSVSSNSSGGRTSSGSGTTSSSGRTSSSSSYRSTTSSGTIYRDTSRTYTGEWESVSISGMTLKMDSGEDYDEALTQTALVNQANNVQMSINIPIGDIPNIPNAETIYALYFTDRKGQPTRMWHTKGQNDHNTLVGHLVQCALRFKRRPSRRITGELFTGRMIDLNSVIQDGKYLQAGFYVNSLELDALEDIYNLELVEMPGLVDAEKPADGDDCILMKGLDFTVKKAVTTQHVIVLLSTDNKIYGFDTATRNLKLFKSYSKTVNINPADGGFCIVEGETAGSVITLMDYRGVAMKKYSGTYVEPVFHCTVLGGYFHVIQKISYINPDTGKYYFSHYSMRRPDHPYTPAGTPGRVGHNELLLGSATIKGVAVSQSAVVVNTAEKAYLLDSRATDGLDAQILSAGTEVLSVSDYYMAENDATYFKIYRRDTYTARTLVTYMSPRADYAAHTLGEVAYSRSTSVYIRSLASGTTKFVKNNAGKTRVTRGLFYINGELYIVRTNAIYKYYGS